MKQFSKAAFATALIAAPLTSMAAGTITFTGKVNDQTCNVAIQGETNPTVTLPTVSVQQLITSGTAGLTPFKVTVSGCKTGQAQLDIDTVFSGAPITVNGNLKNTAGLPAANVEVQLLKNPTGTADSVIALSSVTPVAGLSLAPGAQEAEYEFAARYFSAGSAGAGDVQAVVNYDITYH